MLWRRGPAPMQPLTEQDVTAIFRALFEIHSWTREIWETVVGDEDGEEEDEP